ncbi:MAG: hypothetical protein CM1200mP2_57040 [Planctomycetaceae bacterium]|nr:MAG: hypothetical protein CM1200mP2_57040 [Planctomycetaceae bacterium]
MLDEPAVASVGVVRQLLHRVDPNGGRFSFGSALTSKWH